MADTIAAIATATGAASIMIVRLSGPRACSIAQSVTRRACCTDNRTAKLHTLYDRNGEVIDIAIVVYFQAPKSFTGEDVIEFQCHGGMVIAQEVLETLLASGARLAKPGEFSKRAFLNGKIDLSKAEAIAKIIEAKSLKGAKLLARQLKGEVGEFVHRIRHDLLEILAYSEVMIDYAEEDIPSDLIDSILLRIGQIMQTFSRTINASHRRKGLIEGFRVAIIGKPNVGKSSLLNAFLSYERAIISDIAGTTRDTIEESIKIGSYVVRIIDTAGIREGKDKIEQIGIERSINALNEAEIVIAVFDSSAPFDEQDQHILSILHHHKDSKEIIVVCNKSDLPQVANCSSLKPFRPVFISAHKKIDPLEQRLLELLDEIGSDEELLLASSRQIDALNRASCHLQDALAPLQQGELEFFSYHIKEALQALGSITRPFENEEMLDKMFGSFCLGK